MCTHKLYFEKNKKNIKIFQLKIAIFTAMKKLQYITWACLRNEFQEKK